MAQKLLKVELTVEKEGGAVVVRTLEGGQAERWDEFCNSVAVVADLHGANPPWETLSWDERDADGR